MAVRRMTRIKSFGIEIESSNAPATITVPTSFIGNRSEGTHTFEQESYQRTLDRATFTKTAAIPGSCLARCSFSEELVGGTIQGDAPWTKAVRACGIRQTAMSQFNLSTVTGNFVIGDVVGNNATQGSATKTGRVMLKTGTGGSATVWILPLSGAAFAAAEVLTNYTRSGSGTISGAAVAGGHHYTPWTHNDVDEPPMATIEGRVAGQAFPMQKCRGDVTFMLERNKPLMAQFNFTGIPFGYTNNITPPAAAAVANVNITNVRPRLGKGIQFRMNNGSTSFTPIATQIRVAMGNQVVGEETICDNDVAESGHIQAIITDRNVVASLDPLHVASSDFDFIGYMRSGNTFSFHYVYGDPNQLGGAIVFFAEEARITSDGGMGDRNGTVTHPLELQLTGSDDREIVIAHCFAAA